VKRGVAKKMVLALSNNKNNVSMDGGKESKTRGGLGEHDYVKEIKRNRKHVVSGGRIASRGAGREGF